MGSLHPTCNPLDVAIDGPGFFQVQGPDGNLYYTRDGSFQRDADGNLTTSQGLTIVPPVAVPADANVTLSSDGTVSAQTGDAAPVPVGQIQLANFNNPEGLNLLGDNLAAASPASGAPILGAPGTNGLGRLVPGFLESSNVDIAAEIIAQKFETRVYAANAAVVRAVDEMNRETIDLFA
jgi:flagellar basal-body rod protein FlgG